MVSNTTMSVLPFHAIQDWDLDLDLKTHIASLDWRCLPITTGFSRGSVLRRIGRGWWHGEWGILGFLQTYGVALQSVVTLLNLRIPEHLEQRISEQLRDKFDVPEAPTVRLQVIHSGRMVPIHVDATRETSLVIPIANHDRCFTQFFRSRDDIEDIADPGRCELMTEIEINTPTLIDTKTPHAVRCHRPPGADRPRTSVTAKWQDTTYQDLQERL